MQDKYVNMQAIYINIQLIYGNMQPAFLFFDGIVETFMKKKYIKGSRLTLNVKIFTLRVSL